MNVPTRFCFIATLDEGELADCELAVGYREGEAEEQRKVRAICHRFGIECLPELKRVRWFQPITNPWATCVTAWGDVPEVPAGEAFKISGRAGEIFLIGPPTEANTTYANEVYSIPEPPKFTAKFLGDCR
jgi:hypothetical protein